MEPVHRDLEDVLSFVDFIQEVVGRGAWVAQSVKCWTLGFGSGHDLGVVGSSPTSGSMLSVESA